MQIETIGEHLLRTGPVKWDTNLENNIPMPPRESRQGHCLSRVQSTQAEHERTGNTGHDRKSRVAGANDGIRLMPRVPPLCARLPSGPLQPPFGDGSADDRTSSRPDNCEERPDRGDRGGVLGVPIFGRNPGYEDPVEYTKRKTGDSADDRPGRG